MGLRSRANLSLYGQTSTTSLMALGVKGIESVELD